MVQFVRHKCQTEDNRILVNCGSVGSSFIHVLTQNINFSDMREFHKICKVADLQTHRQYSYCLPSHTRHFNCQYSRLHSTGFVIKLYFCLFIKQ